MTKRIVILGGGESGVGAAILAKDRGFDVFLSDKSPLKEKYSNILKSEGIPFEEGKHTDSLILNADEVIKSPGIPEKAEIIKELHKKNIPVISEIEFAGRYKGDSFTVCITGSNGKTTTTLLTTHILQKAGLDVSMAGNVGKSLAYQVARDPHKYYVLELSSFQLDNMYDFRADIAILLNITPDHLDRYEYKIENYAASKFRITNNQRNTDHFIFCSDDPLTQQFFSFRKGDAIMYPFSIEKEQGQYAWLQNNEILINPNTPFTMSIFELALQGKHNIYNSMASGIASRILEIRKDVIRESLADFKNAEHRLEPVLTVHGIEFINDSKATNVNSTWYALESMDKPVVLILGGVDKGNDYSMLKELVRDKVKAIICLGKDNTRIHEAFQDVVENIVDVSSAQEAVKSAYYLGKQGDVVLLSPACASFDLFENYEDRGRQFKEAVRSL